jgi:uncharacterized membrane protein YuzA (DUF378 family)
MTAFVLCALNRRLVGLGCALIAALPGAGRNASA